MSNIPFAREILKSALAMDDIGGLYVSDLLNNRIRRISLRSEIWHGSVERPIPGKIFTVVGTGSVGPGCPGENTGNSDMSCSPLVATLNHPRGIAFDKISSLLYIIDSGNYKIRKVYNFHLNTLAHGGDDLYNGQDYPSFKKFMTFLEIS